MSPDELLEWLYENPEEMVAVDTETDGLRVDDGRHRCIGISIACSAGSAYFPVAHTAFGSVNIDDDTFCRLEWVLRQGRYLGFANRNFDVLSLETVGIFVDDMPFYDAFTMSRIIDPSDHDKEVTLDDLGLMYLGHRGKIVDWPYEVVDEKGRTVKESTLAWQKKNGWPDTTPEMIYEYACVDAELTLEVIEAILASKWWQKNPPTVWERKQNTMRITCEMKRRGALLDLDLVYSELDLGVQRMAELREEMQFNPKSHKDNMRIFIDELHLPVIKVSKKTGLPSFDRTVMQEYEPMLERLNSPLANQVKEYRGWSTAVGLLLRPWTEFVSPDGRIRSEFTTHVTATGRLSSRKPNLQQISKESQGKRWKEKIKPCIVAKPGYRLISFDYSQLELRMAVAYCEEPVLQQVFEEGRDIFTEMSGDLGMNRQDTKTFVYSVQYGAGVPRIMNAFGVSELAARKMRSKFYRTYPRFRALDLSCRTRAESELAIRLWSGRIRRFSYPSENYKAMNALIQGGAADVVEAVWWWIMQNIDNQDCRCLLQVHDALVFEIREDLVDHYTPIILAAMEDVQGITGEAFPVKFAVEASDWALAA